MVFRGRLCGTCSGFGFDKDHPPFGENVLARSNVYKSEGFLKLGLLGHVRVRNCPLCKLVTFATLEIQRTENYLVGDGDEVGLWWLTHGTDCGVFSVYFGSRGISKGTVLSFVRSRSEPVHASPHNLYMPVSQSQVDFGKVRSWLAECEQNHSTCYLPPQYRRAALNSIFPGLKILRLLDVRQQCLVEVDEFTRYVTLSYVWGSVPSLRLSRANRYSLMQPGAIQQAWDLIPKTIQDSITMTQLVGERYLWVDSLCLVQNDPEDLQHGTSVMDLIYEQSIICIVAAGGKDANAGLRGVGSGSRETSQTIAEIEPGLRLAVYTDPCYLLEDTVYSSRAWTNKLYHADHFTSSTTKYTFAASTEDTLRQW
ncbi:unnamed protein product [Clonostachys rosea]|uniref:Heterokaryon incompatibility domain-containing protein n=1 Tax=Bionectria ochroleuca TaxID=29856 RepID=A0ABY6UZZ7_BIOOC|nr:unnamed protein product [Clonostachys rosea]